MPRLALPFPRERRLDWASLPRRVLELDVLRCAAWILAPPASGDNERDRQTHISAVLSGDPIIPGQEVQRAPGTRRVKPSMIVARAGRCYSTKRPSSAKLADVAQVPNGDL